MKKLLQNAYFVIAALCVILALIIVFQNAIIFSSYAFFILFWTINGGMGMFFFLFFLGLMSGFFFGILKSSMGGRNGGASDFDL